MSRRTKRIIAVVELFFALAIILYALGPRSLADVSQGVYEGPASVTAITVDSAPANRELGEEADTHLELDPDSQAGQALLDLLDRRYIPYYADTDWSENVVSYETTVTLTTEKGDFLLTFTEAAPIRADSDLADKTRTYRVLGGAFQGELLDFILEQTEAA